MRTSYSAFDVVMMISEMPSCNPSPTIKDTIRFQTFNFFLLFCIFISFYWGNGFPINRKREANPFKKDKSIIRLKLNANPIGMNFWSLSAAPKMCAVGVCDPKSFFFKWKQICEFCGIYISPVIILRVHHQQNFSPTFV